MNKKIPQTEQQKKIYQCLEEFYIEAKKDLLIDMLDPEIIAKYGKTQEERMVINTYLRSHLSTFVKSDIIVDKQNPPDVAHSCDSESNRRSMNKNRTFS